MKREDAVSSVVSAVLVFSLFSTAALMWTVTQLPNWIEEREDIHAGEVRHAFDELQATLEQMASSGNPGPVTRTIELGPAPVPVLQRTQTLGALAIEDGHAVTGAFTNGALHVLGSNAAGDPDASLATPIDGVATLEFLFLQFRTNSLNNNQMASVVLTATDGADTVTARVVQTDQNGGAYARTSCDSMELNVQVTNTLGVTSTHVVQCRLDKDVDLRMDLLESELGIGPALTELEPGYAMSWSTADSGNGDADGSTFKAVWRDPAGLMRTAGAGQASTYSLDEAGQALVMETNAQELDARDIAWDLGAVAVAQSNGMVLARDPDLEIQVNGTQGSLRWTLITLSGTTGSVSGESATLSLRLTGTTDVVLTADTASFVVDGPRAEAWRNHFADLVVLGGLADVTAGGSGDLATLDLEDSTVTSWTAYIRILHATVALQ